MREDLNRVPEPDDSLRVEQVTGVLAGLGEGAIWDVRVNRLYWVDIPGMRLFELDPESGRVRDWDVGQLIGTVVPRTRGGLILAMQDGITGFDPDTGRTEWLARPEDYDPVCFRFNDGKCDPAGRFWVGSYSITPEKRPGTLYRMDPDGTMHAMLRGVGTSNGITWHRERRVMYFIDTPLLRADAFDYDEARGTVTNRRAAVTFPDGVGRPDGSTMDAEGMLWIAHWDGGCVTRWNPLTGECLQTVRVPASRVTSCAFGGPELDRLYITTARKGLSESDLHQQPQAGGLFRVRPGVRGVPAVGFAG
jgi:sugar lactone lactonase YvrE